MHYIAFKAPVYSYQKLLDAGFPAPTVTLSFEDQMKICYHFRGGWKSSRQMIHFGLLKANIEQLLKSIRWLDEPLCYGTDDPIYEIDSFIAQFALFRKWPRWIWPKHRKELRTCLKRYAVRLFERDILYFEILLGAAHMMNNRLKSKITSREKLESLVKWCYAQTKEAEEKGKLVKPYKGEALSHIRSKVGQIGGKKSANIRQKKTSERRQLLAELLPNFIQKDKIDLKSLSHELGVSSKTLQRDLKALREKSLGVAIYGLLHVQNSESTENRGLQAYLS